ncbi:hypothetical protein K7432_009800 [Basidiobolus ranarum]|uniref:Uncharacterized protein n=1 Tax=Basidiobolus ranarum TaxID=34480 RepID=A0ABR2VWH3_9FUNG
MAYIKTSATCCCCINLRVGCLILTFLQLIVGIVTTVLVILNWVGVTNSSFGSSNTTVVNPNSTLQTLGNIGQYVSFGSFIVMLLIGIFGFFGTLKCKPWMLLIYVIITSIIMLANLVGVVLSFINKQWYNGLLALISLLIQGYFIYAVYRYRKVILAAKHELNYSGAYIPDSTNQEYNAHPYNTAQPMSQQPANIVHAPDKSYGV